MPRSRICRASTTVSAFRCYRRRRESWLTTKRAKRMWAAKFSSRCSEEGISMSRIGKKPVTVPTGVTATVEGQTVKMKGPKGQLQFVVHDDVEVKFENGAVTVAPRVETNRAQALTDRARAGGQSGRRRHQGVREEARDHRRRLSCRAAGQEPAARARLQPRRGLCVP